MNHKKILLVDDEEDTLMVLEKQLTAEGYAVVTANNGHRALIAAKSEQPDLIVLDVKMPGMDGGEVAFMLSQNPLTKNIPIIYSTCLLSENEDYRSGEKIMLAKSKDSRELISVIDKVLS